VRIAPVSNEIRCYQGILPGISRFLDFKNALLKPEAAELQRILRNSLLELTGKIFQRTGNFLVKTSNFYPLHGKR
jgi:hypothetical protein